MHCRLLGVVAAAALATAMPAGADVRLSISNGQVTLSAKDATAPQILAEWARVGRTRIVNGERVTGGPLTLELTGVSEVQALEIILRAASGYVLAPRAENGAGNGASRFDRIFIVPTSNAPRAAAPSAPTPSARPAFQPPRFAPRQPRPQDSDEPPDEAARRPPLFVNPPPADQPPPTVNPFPQPAGAQPFGNTGAGAISAPVGVPVPGMVLPAPAPPAQGGAPNNPPR